MLTDKDGKTILVPVVEEVARLSESERAELLASLEQSRADYAAGRCHVLEPGMLRKEFEAILRHDLSDEELDSLLGIAPQPPR